MNQLAAVQNAVNGEACLKQVRACKPLQIRISSSIILSGQHNCLAVNSEETIMLMPPVRIGKLEI
ncbi:hypothetical protein AD950_00500 [Gluconobacter oxydans]|nr:hypothetical protein AD950_00500 [Gluconobacter oxydans]